MGVCNTRGQMYNRGVCGQSRPKTAGFFCHDAMSKVEALVEKPAKFYSAEDVEKPLANKRKPKALRSSITPESVLIILAGRFKGKRVVFLAAGNRLRWSENYLEQAAIYKLKRMIQDMLGNELYIGAYMESNALEACFNNSPFKKLHTNKLCSETLWICKCICEPCHGQAQRLLNFAMEMEDSIVDLSF